MLCTYMTPIHFSYVKGVPYWLTEMGEECVCEHYTARPTWEGMQQRTHPSVHACPVLQGYHHMHTGVTHSSVLQVVACCAVVDCFQITEHWKVVQRDFP